MIFKYKWVCFYLPEIKWGKQISSNSHFSKSAIPTTKILGTVETYILLSQKIEKTCIPH